MVVITPLALQKVGLLSKLRTFLPYYEHAAEWGELLEWETTPVLTDDQAGEVASKLFT